MPVNAQREELDYSADATVGTESLAAYPNFRRQYDAGPERKWQIEVQKALSRLVKMEKNWDSYNAPPVGRDVAFFAIEVLQGVMRAWTPEPTVVPSSVGGVQLEWHKKGIDLEVHIAAPYQCEMWFRDHRDPTAQPVSVEITNDFSPLVRPIELLTTR